MTFKFIHTADWQLGRAFANMPSDLAGELAAQRFAVIARIAAIARTEHAQHVLVAGDVFDAPDLPNAVLHRALARMAEHEAVTWVLLPGNHDPARPGGIWDRVERFNAAKNILVVRHEAVIMLTERVALLPAPLTSKNPGRDPTQWMDAAATPEGVLRIGLAHGSVQGFGSDGESSVMIDRNRALTAGLNYLALGDWHGTTRVGPEVWYAGTPEPDRFPNNDPGNVLAVTLDDAGAASVEKIPSAHFTWAKFEAPLHELAGLTGIEETLAGRGTALSALLVQLTLSGSLSLADHAALDAWREKWSGRLRYLDVDTAALAVRATSTDFENLGGDGPLVEAARLLAEKAGDPAHAEHATAALALQRLFGFAAEVAHGAAR